VRYPPRFGHLPIRQTTRQLQEGSLVTLNPEVLPLEPAMLLAILQAEPLRAAPEEDEDEDEDEDEEGDEDEYEDEDEDEYEDEDEEDGEDE
jgi:hypothetical protein